jgi:glycerophosphoryl diester phosphodiesterase
MTRPVLRIAHRGMPRRFPENTMPSFEAALAAGADGIELDVHATSDGVVVVHHDARLRGGAEIRRTPWARVREHRVAPHAAVPTLDEVCRLVGERAALFVEIKGAGIEDAVIDVLDGHACDAAIHSFDHEMIGRLAARGGGRRLGLLFDEAPTDACTSLRLHGALDLWPESNLVTERLVRDVHAMDGRVLPWTVNDGATAARLARWGVDGICTDDVAMLVQA